ncbi:MAG: hypothetical protein K0U36_03410, partial [Alphaproteobacteria bacterium]|nr:hypothetical protein [Alphaproteobacteria bacterium]
MTRDNRRDARKPVHHRRQGHVPSMTAALLALAACADDAAPAATTTTITLGDDVVPATNSISAINGSDGNASITIVLADGLSEGGDILSAVQLVANDRTIFLSDLDANDVTVTAGENQANNATTLTI